LPHLPARRQVGRVIGLRIRDTFAFFKNHPSALGDPPATNHCPAAARAARRYGSTIPPCGSACLNSLECPQVLAATTREGRAADAVTMPARPARRLRPAPPRM
jgi:hypothetical protein